MFVLCLCLLSFLQGLLIIGALLSSVGYWGDDPAKLFWAIAIFRGILGIGIGKCPSIVLVSLYIWRFVSFVFRFFGCGRSVSWFSGVFVRVVLHFASFSCFLT